MDPRGIVPEIREFHRVGADKCGYIYTERKMIKDKLAADERR
jgi:hypothetical protein